MAQRGFSSSLAGGGGSAAATARNIISSATSQAQARNTYTPAPAYTPPPVPAQPRWTEPAPVSMPPSSAARTTATVRNPSPAPAAAAPKPAPVKSTVQQLIDKASKPQTPSTPAPTVIAPTPVSPWRGLETIRKREDYGPQTRPTQPYSDVAAGNLLYDLDNLNAMIGLAQDRENENYVPGMGYFPDTQAPDEGAPNGLLELLDQRAHLLGNAPTWTDWVSAATGGLVSPETIGNAMSGLKTFASGDNEPESGVTQDSRTGAFGQGPAYYPAPPSPLETGVLVWNPVTRQPERVYGDPIDYYAAFGLDTAPTNVLGAVGDLGSAIGGFWGDLSGYLADALNAGGGGSSYGGGGGSGGYGGSYGGGGGSAGAGSAGGGGGSSIGGIPVGDVTSTMDGWAARYLPASAQQVLENPQVIGVDTIRDLGFDSDQLEALFGDQAGYIANQLLPFLFADTPIGQTPSIASVINKLHDVLVNQATPGGATFDVAKLLHLLFGQAAQPADAQNPTLMGGMFAGLTPSEQAQAMSALVSNASNWAATPFFGQAIRNWYDTQQTNYLSGALSATPDERSLGEILQSMVFPGAS